MLAHPRASYNGQKRAIRRKRERRRAMVVRASTEPDELVILAGLALHKITRLGDFFASKI
jgi:hypothetical protein